MQGQKTLCLLLRNVRVLVPKIHFRKGNERYTVLPHDFEIFSVFPNFIRS